MYDLHELYCDALEVMENCGLYGRLGAGDIRNIETVKAVKMTGKFGYCSVKRDVFGDPTYSIKINAALLDGRNPYDSIMNTILHELLHTCIGCMNHGELWTSYADRIKRKYPQYEISRTSTAEKEGICAESIEQMRAKKKYAIVCNKCGEICAEYVRKCYAVNFPEKCTHRGCGGNCHTVNLV